MPETFVADTVAVTATTLDLTPYVAPTTATVATVVALPPAVSPGSLSATSISIVASGPRYDISGSVTLTVAGTAYTGTVEGRIGIDEAPELSLIHIRRRRRGNPGRSRWAPHH